MPPEEFNGYSFDEPDMRKKMKYVVVRSGDLDLNNAYAFKSYKELKAYMEEDYQYSSRNVYAVFKIKDITNKFQERKN